MMQIRCAKPRERLRGHRPITRAYHLLHGLRVPHGIALMGDRNQGSVENLCPTAELSRSRSCLPE